MRRLLWTWVLVGLFFGFGCDEEKSAAPGTPAAPNTPAAQETEKPIGVNKTMIKLETSKGDIVIELNKAKAPLTVANFLSYVKSGQFDGTIFHRVIKGFMIQGGGFTPEMQQKPTNPPVKNEAANGLKNERGTIAMARTNDPHSATCQFFINHATNTFLDFAGPSNPGYAVFGKVTKGMEVVDAIANTPTGVKAGMRDVPVDTILIKKATVISEEKPADAEN